MKNYLRYVSVSASALLLIFVFLNCDSSFDTSNTNSAEGKNTPIDNAGIEDLNSESVYHLASRDETPNNEEGWEQETTPDQLVEQVRALGYVRVIVEMRLSQSPGSYSNLYEEEIVIARKRLLNSLALFKVEVTAKYQSLPLLGLRVGPIALGYLLASEQVVNLSEDSVYEQPYFPDPPKTAPFLPVNPPVEM